MKTFKQFVEHHQTDANGKVIEHGDGTPSSVEEAKKKGLDGKECWDGYKLAGTKKKGGKTVDNCVKVDEAKVEAGRSDYGKASVRNKRKFGKEGEPAIFDASGERGKMIDQRRAEHKAKRGVKEDYYRGTGEKVVARTKKFMDKKGQKGAPGLDAMKARAAEHKAKRGVKEEVVTELNRYGKETGKATGSINKRAGTPVKKGGNTRDKALLAVRKMIRRDTGKPEGQQKKVKGEKDRVQYGNRKTTPADSIAKRRQSRADAEKLMRDTSGT